MTVQPILEKFTVLETVIQGLHIIFCNLLDILLLDPDVYALRKWLILVFWETTNAGRFKILHSIALGSLYISTGNDVNSYFRLAANSVKCSFWVKFGSRFLYNGSTDSEKSLQFWKLNQWLHFRFSNLLDVVAP